jgi:mannose-1-phosphate guanylyltransferase
VVKAWRLWSISRDDCPKLFIKLFGEESLIQKFYSRAKSLKTEGEVLVSYADRVRGVKTVISHFKVIKKSI